MDVLAIGSSGPAVADVQRALRNRGIALAVNGIFDGATRHGVVAFQRAANLTPDGIVGPQTAAALGLVAGPPLPPLLGRTVPLVSRMFPGAPVRHIEQYLPGVLQALADAGLVDRVFVVMALATIRAETAGFIPISEAQNEFNTSPGGHPFDRYDRRADLGNLGPPDGERYRGRGFIQLTGRANYARHGPLVGVPTLVDTPERANEADIAARLLASFISASRRSIQNALAAGDLARARRLVNGGTHGLEAFTDAYNTGNQVLPNLFAIDA
jgi:peptidoglycan L-alanyl-D-glutamate endopeptidase CwlK